MKDRKAGELKVVVGMSGGVDSSLAAAWLKQQGYQVMGLWLDLWGGQKGKEGRQKVETIAKQLGTDLQIVDKRKEFEKEVIKWTMNEFKQGRTPNPCVRCNQRIKFKWLYEWMEKHGDDFLATGHYARIKNGRLYRAVDEKKDQTYFLYYLKQKQLKRILFPVGGMSKDEVRQEVKKLGLPGWDKKGSAGLCFAADKVKFNELLARRLGIAEGEVVDIKGKVIGKHKGVWLYTIGQRHGFEINSRSIRRPRLFVVSKHMEKNRLVVGEKKDLLREGFKVKGWSLIRRIKLEQENLQIRIRHGGELVNCRVRGKKVELKKKVFGLAGGQAGVVYRGNECLGGGVIV